MLKRIDNQLKKQENIKMTKKDTTMKITIKNARNNVILVTDSDNYKSTINANRDALNCTIFVEYGDRSDWRYWEDFSLEYKNERAVINVNNRLVFAEWNKDRIQGCNGHGVELETLQQHINDIIEFLDTDFATDKEVVKPYNEKLHKQRLEQLINGEELTEE